MQRQFDRRRGGHGAKPAERQMESVDQRPALRRKPDGDRLERRHEAASDAHADQGPCQKKDQQRISDRKQEGAGSRYHQQCGVHPARPEAVEQQTERQLESGETHEIGAGQQPQISRVKGQIARDVLGNDRVYRAIKV